MYQRSYQLLTPENSLLLIVDVQERLMPVIGNHELVAFNTKRLIDAAVAMDVGIVVSEQYPKGLGPTLPSISQALPDGTAVFEKKTFSVCAVEEIRAALDRSEASRIVLCGVETHICVLQSAFDLLAMGKEVVLVADAVGSRFAEDRRIALQSLESSGVVLSTTESVMFQWCHTAEHAKFKTISTLARESFPAAGEDPP